MCITEDLPGTLYLPFIGQNMNPMMENEDDNLYSPQQHSRHNRQPARVTRCRWKTSKLPPPPSFPSDAAEFRRILNSLLLARGRHFFVCKRSGKGKMVPAGGVEPPTY